MANFGFTITVEGKEKLQEIEKIVNKIGEKQNIKLNIDTSFSNKISDIENKLKNIEETIKNSNSIKFTPISKDTESQINNANNRINELGRTIKTVSKYGQTGDIKEQIQTINTELGKTVQIINHYKNGIFSGTNENHITNYDKIAKSIDKITNKIEKYKQSLNSIENNGNIFGKLNTDNVANSFQALDNMDYLLHKIKGGGQVQELDIKKAFDEADKSLKILQQDYDRVSKLNSLNNQYKELLSTAKQFKDLGLNHIGVFNGNSKITGINNELKNLKQALNSRDLSSAEQIISKIQSELGHLKVNDKMLINLSTQLKNIRNQYNELKSGKDIFSQINESDINNYLKSLKQVENIRKRLKENSKTVNGLELTQAINQTKEYLGVLQRQSTQIKNVTQAKEQMQSTLNQLKTNNIVDTSVIENFQNRLNTINTKTPIQEIRQLKNEIKNMTSGNVSGESGIARIQNKIATLETTLKNIKGNSKFSNIINSNQATNEIRQVETEINKLKNILNTLKSGGNISSANLSVAFKNADNSAKQLKNTLNNINSNTRSLGSRLQNALGNVGIYISTGIAFRKVFNIIEDGINSVIELEDAMVSLRRVYDLTDQQAVQFQQTLMNTATSLGQNASEYINAVTEFKKLGYNINDASNLAENTTKFNLAGDINNLQESTKDVVSTLKGFGLEANNVTDIIDKMNNVSNNYALSAEDIATILQKSSATMKASGNSLEESIALGTVAQEVQQDSSKVGNALKTISQRIRGVSEDGEELNADLREEVKNYANGFDILKDDGSFKSTYEIFKGIGKEWSNMTSMQQAKLGEDLFGKHNLTTGYAILQNYQQLDKVMNTIGDSAGSVNQEFNRYLDSTSAKIEILKNTISEKWVSLIDSNTTKGVVQEITKLVNTFGNLRGIVLLATTTLLLFKGKAILGLVTDIASAIAGESALTVATVGLTSAFNTLKSAFLTNPFGILALGLTSIIALIGQVKTTADEVNESVDKFNESQSKIQDLNNAQDLVNQYENLQQKLKDGKLSGDEYNNTMNSMKEIQRQLAEQFPDLVSGFDNEGNAIVTNMKKVQSEINNTKQTLEANRLSAIKTAYNDITDTGFSKQFMTPWEDVKNNLTFNDKTARKSVSKSNQLPSGSYIDLGKYQYYLSLQKRNKDLTKDEQEMMDSILQEFENYNKMIDQAHANGDDILGLKYIDINKGVFVDAEKHYQKIAEKSEEIKKNNKEATDNLPKYSVENTSKSYSSAIGNVGDAYKIINSINEEGKLTPDIIQQTISKFPDVGMNIQNITRLQEFLNSKIAEQKNIAQTAYTTMLENDEQYFQTKVRNTDTYTNFVQQATQSMTDIKIKHYQANVDAMKTELENCKTLAQAELLINQQVTEALSQVWANYYKNLDAVKSASGEVIGYEGAYDNHGNLKKGKNKKGKKYSDIVKQYSKEANSAWKLQKALNNLKNGTSANFKMPDFSANDFKTQTQKNKDKKEKKEQEKKEQERDYSVANLKLEDYIDNTFRLDNLIQNCQHDQKIYSAEIENTYGNKKRILQQKYINSLKQEQQLKKQLIDTDNADLKNLKNQISQKSLKLGYKIEFTSGGNIANLNEAYKTMIKLANSMRDNDEASSTLKKNRQKEIEDLKNLVTKYRSLQGEIQSTREDYEQLTNTIKEYNSQIVDNIGSLESSLSSAITNKIDKTFENATNELDKLKDKINKTFEDEDYEDSKAEKQKTLLDLRSQIRNASIQGNTALVKTLTDQYNDAQKELNKLVKDHEKDNILNKIDDEKDTLGKQKEDLETPENLTKMIQQAITNGYVTIQGQVIQVTNLTNEYVKNTTTGNANIAKGLSEINKLLANNVGYYQKLNSLTKDAGLLTNISSTSIQQSWGTTIREAQLKAHEQAKKDNQQIQNITVDLSNSTINGIDDYNNLIEATLEQVGAKLKY